MVLLQEELRIRDDLKLQGIRDRARERTIRFMNSRERSIGIDKKGLDLQVEEKRQKNVMQEQENKEEATYMKQICHLMEQEEILAREEKMSEIESVKQTILQQMKEPKNNAIKMDGPLNVERCGFSSAQHFSGEDPNFTERRKLHQRQICDWSHQKIQENRDILEQEREEKKQYDEYVRVEDNHRSIIEQQEIKQKIKASQSLQMDNIKRAKEIAKKRTQEDIIDKQEKVDEVRHAMSDPFLTEDTDYFDPRITGERAKFRPDLFKGFSKDHIKLIYKQNDAVLCEKEKSKKKAIQENQAWEQYQVGVLEEMDKAEYDRQLKINSDNQVLTETLHIQRKEFKEKQDRAKIEKFGAISNGFFQNFGKSCR